MKAYLDLLDHLLKNGVVRDDRTGTGTLGCFGYQMRFDLSKGFPVTTTKKLHLRSIIHELLWSIQGDTNIKYLKDNGIDIIDISSYNIEETFSIAILYITNLGTKTDESISYSMTENIINDLGYINSMRIPAFTEVVKYKNSDIHNDDIARKLQVNNILQGLI